MSLQEHNVILKNILLRCDWIIDSREDLLLQYTVDERKFRY
jgi:hypothetical protein